MLVKKYPLFLDFILVMVNKYGLYILSGLAIFFSIFGAYLKPVNEEMGDVFLIISVFTTTIFLIYLLFYIKKIRNELKELKKVD